MTRFVSFRFQTLLATCVTSLVASAPVSASITGVCPDGSVFIVQHQDSIPCRDAKAVDPQDVPPIRPEYLSRPYGWEIFNRKNDPNNPYNLIQTPPRRAQRNDGNATEQGRATESPRPEQRVQTRAEFRSEPEAQVPQHAFGLAESELGDLARIVDLSQRRAPASILTRDSGGRLQLARSNAFETRVRGQLGSDVASGNVVLFKVDTQQAGSFHGQLTFVQGHVAYQPVSDDPRQLGLLRGQLGELRTDEPVLGYVVLPQGFDLGSPLDIYWNDQQVTATLAP